MLYVLTYIEIDVFCLLFLAHILLKTQGFSGTEQEVLTFKKVIYLSMGILLSDILWMMTENGIIERQMALDYILNIIYYVLMTVMAFCWLKYIDLRLHWKHMMKNDFFRNLFLSAPIMVSMVLCMASIGTGWVFTITDNCKYERGPLYFLQILMTGGYLLAAIYHALYLTAHSRQKLRVHNARVLAFSIALPIIGQLAELAVPGLPIVLPAITLSLSVVFADLQEQQVSTDVLTGLNNRRRTDEYFQMIASETAKEQRVYFYMADLNHFKDINDHYGHIEGDNALIITAKALMEVSGERDAFVSRLGVDEFCIIWHLPENTGPQVIVCDVQEELKRQCELAGTPYQLSISFGYSTFQNDSDSMEELKGKADKMLYENKKIAHGCRSN